MFGKLDKCLEVLNGSTSWQYFRLESLSWEMFSEMMDKETAHTIVHALNALSPSQAYSRAPRRQSARSGRS